MYKLLIFLFIPYLAFSQSEKEMLDAGFKKGTVKTIIKKFDGSVSDAINKWADSGNGKLSKKFIEAAEKLGYNKVYLESKLKLARKERLKQGIVATLAAATVVASAAAGGAGSGAGANDSSSYSPYYYNKNYDYSSSNKTYEVSSIEPIQTNYFDSSYLSNDTSYQTHQNDNSIYGDFVTNSANQIEPADTNSFKAPMIYGTSSSYIDGTNTYNTGFDETGLLNVYDSSGITIGAMKKDDTGTGYYEDGILKSFTSNPDNSGVSVTYNNGSPVSASKYEDNGDISHYDSSGTATGYSKKVKGGYENYDSSGILQSFTSTGD